jgi:hypothetical protein
VNLAPDHLPFALDLIRSETIIPKKGARTGAARERLVPVSEQAYSPLMPACSRNPERADLFEGTATPELKLAPSGSAHGVLPRTLLPTDLDGSLAILSEAEFDRLYAGVLREAARRGKVVSSAPPAGETSPSKRSIPPARKVTAGHEVTSAMANLVRAAFKAGVKPNAIARQFGLAPTVIRDILNGERR